MHYLALGGSSGRVLGPAVLPVMLLAVAAGTADDDQVVLVHGSPLHTLANQQLLQSFAVEADDYPNINDSHRRG